eukprot:4493208-Pleurochrysis_carterae.AAC.2
MNRKCTQNRPNTSQRRSLPGCLRCLRIDLSTKVFGEEATTLALCILSVSRPPPPVCPLLDAAVEMSQDWNSLSSGVNARFHMLNYERLPGTLRLSSTVPQGRPVLNANSRASSCRCLRLSVLCGLLAASAISTCELSVFELLFAISPSQESSVAV